MKSIKFLMAFIAISVATFSLTSCNEGKKDASAKTEKNDTSEVKGKEFTSLYICPMHCKGSGSEKPGTCPVCGMDYKKNEDYKANGETGKDHSHDGHSHDGDNHEGHNH
jgi:hypothetical protein